MSDSDILELHSLCSAAVDRRLDRASGARLNALLAGSEEARELYVRWMALSASLHDYASELQTDEPEEQSALTRILHVPAWRWTLGCLAAAASVLFAFWISDIALHPRSGTLAAASDDDTSVATVSAATDCRWGGTGPALGDELEQGRQLELLSGFAEITFNSGAQVVLEGPAGLDLASAWGAVLRHGSLRANVPPEAVGFRVSNADVKVIDLGTEFSMTANAGGGTEVFVLKGSVEASAGGVARPVTLREQQARRFDRSRMSEVRDREQKLKRWASKSKLLQFTQPARYVHWSFDEKDTTAVRAETVGLTGSFDGRLIGNVRRVNGHRAGALAFDGASAVTASIAAPGKGGSTVAFWVCVPDDAALSEAGPMVALGGEMRASISWNRDPTQGTLGALRTKTERGQSIGAASLRDGRWHHVAVVTAPGGRVRQYVDGRLEAAEGKRLKVRHNERRHGGAAAEMANNTITIGGGSDGSAGEHFRGMIDELFLADRALTPPEIRQLLRENQPAPPPVLADAG